MEEDHESLGPLSRLVGVWVGEGGRALAPSPSGDAIATQYRERVVVEPIGRIPDHAQELYGVAYEKTAWLLPLEEQLERETGYWLWEPGADRVMLALIAPRGVALLAGGDASPTSSELLLIAERGSETFGICCTPFLSAELKPVRYEMTVGFGEDNQMTYRSIAFIEVPGQPEMFRDTHENTLRRVHRSD